MIRQMDVKRTTIWFVIWAIAILFFKWFMNELVEMFTLFLLIIPIVILLASAVVFAVWAIVFLIKNRNKEHFKAAIPLFILVVTVSLVIFVPSDLLKVKLEHELFSEKRMEIVTQIQDNELVDDGIGNVELPSFYRFLSSDGEAYIYENDEDGTVVGFWVFRGLMVSPYSSVIYTSFSAKPTAETLNCSKIYDIKKLGENWYYVTAY